MYQIEINRNGNRRVLKDPITGRPHTFDNRDDAETFGNSWFQLQRCDWKNAGQRLPTYKIVAHSDNPAIS